ncbi:aminotransferase class V-fold PLP-dependent enzyme [Marinigracilibium pacificum]|uniref:Cysteine desulfurase n=1 Tax=Marinigracilibium pacificum TaxID=2729599 RepID=A0A848JBX1_9BACT|nr:cysteine desulfurase [Marinigracilibium pacificum]NMM50502.1 cysteine desulfurase [Marinigracilibium pacificum]
MSVDTAPKPINIKDIRDQFPVLHQLVNKKPLAYFDNAATTQKPKQVIESLEHYYTKDNANIHRGIHTLAERATTAFEETREVVKQFINAPEKEEVIFTKGTTDSINLVASSYGRKFLSEGDIVIISAMEHHSNIVPWQLICEEKGAELKIIPVNDRGELDFDAYKSMLSDKVKIVSVVYASNSLGTINPVKQIVAEAHKVGAVTMIDGAQAASHLPFDVQDIDCDFLAFSGHKMYGPTGVGVLYGKRQLLESMPPYQGGGEMISEVTFKKSSWNDIPYKFEAGTPNIGDVVALKEAIHFINKIGKENIMSHEMGLHDYAMEKLSEFENIKFYGTAAEKVGVISFLFDNIHPFDIGQMLDSAGVAVRTGHHCTQPLMDLFNIEGTVRASFSVYNTKEEVDAMIASLQKVVKIFG